MRSKFSLLYFSEVLFVICVLLIISRSFMKQLYLMSGGLFLFSNYLLIPLLFFSFFILIINRINFNRKIKLIYFLGFVFFLIILFWSSINNISKLGIFIDFKNLVFNYLGVILIFISLAFGVRFKYKESIFRLLYVFCFFQVVLGILQHLTSNTIVPTEFEGESLVSTIYYLDGISSKYNYLLEYGGSVRAFGMTDSALTLGMFALLGLANSIKFNNSLGKYLSILIFLFGIYCTLTRLVWASTLLLVGLYFYCSKRKKLINMLYFLALLFQVLIIILGFLISNFSDDFQFPTIISRLEGYIYFIEILHPDFIDFFIGQNFLNWIPDFDTAYSVDNEFLKMFFDIGIIGILLVYSLYFKAFSSINDDMARSALLLFPFFGIANVVGYFFIPMTLIYLMTYKSYYVRGG